MDITRAIKLLKQSIEAHFGVPKDIDVTDLANKEGFLGNHMNVQITFQNSNLTNLHLFVKRSKHDYSDSVNSPLISNSDIAKFNKQEVNFFSRILPALKYFVKMYLDPDILSLPNCYLALMENTVDSIIILENIKMKGFELRTQEDYTLRSEEIQITFNALGQLQGWLAAYAHSLAMNVEELLANKLDLYSMLKQLISEEECSCNAEKFAKYLPSNTSQEIDSICRFKEFLGKRYHLHIKQYFENTNLLCGLRHNDCWANNLLFRGKEESLQVAIIDWQTWTYGPIAMDLVQFLMISCNRIAHVLCESNLTPLLEGYVQNWRMVWKIYGKEPILHLDVEGLRGDIFKSLHAGYMMHIAFANLMLPNFPNETLKWFASNLSYVIDHFPPEDL